MKYSSTLALFLSIIYLRSIHTIDLTDAPAFSVSLWNQQRQSTNPTKNPLTFQNKEARQLQSDDQIVYQSHNFTQLITHSDLDGYTTKDGRTTFDQRYWFDPRFYQKGGPIILLDGGETDGEDRLPFLKNGVLSILCKATHGIGIVLEHRYYGKSFPFGDLSTDSLRYLNTREALDDSAYFSKNLILPGYETLDLTAPNTPWIYYGGSYAGSKAAFMIKLYPDLIWGAIASSAVIHAELDFWQYYEPIRRHAPKTCMEPLIKITETIDQILGSKDPHKRNLIKDVFGLSNVTDDRDFVNVLATPLGSWQSKNWDQTIDDHTFETYCQALSINITDPDPDPIPIELENLLRSIDPTFPILNFINYATYIKLTIADTCVKLDQDECFGTGEVKGYLDVGLDQTWRSWMWQVCNEWGYFQGSAPLGRPSLVSRLIDLDYNSRVCQFAFGDAVPRWPNTAVINQYGSYAIDGPRLAFVDGTYDPWLYVTVHSPLVVGDREWEWTIKGGVHHWDENGIDEDEVEPRLISEVHRLEVRWVKEWVKEFYLR